MTDQRTWDLLGEIRDELRTLNARHEPPKTKPGYQVKLGRVFSAGQTIPDDVDLVMADGGLRWCREFEHTAAGSLPTDNWYPRGGEGPILSTAELLARAGHVTEILAPKQEG